MSISVSNITKSYNEQKALNNVSFEITEGEIVGFLGPNGAGKSTMMKILTTYLNPTQGEALVNGFEISSQATDVQKSVGYLPEHNPLYLEMYVREYLNFNAQVYKISKSRIEEVINLTGLTPEANKKIEQLSKGYRQLLEIRELIKSIGKEKTIFLSTHIMQEVEAMCDRVLIINRGEIVTDKYLSDILDEKEQIIQVEFDYRVEEAFLLKLPHVSIAKNVQGFLYEIHFDTKTDMRPVVFDFAHDNQLKILQLSRKNKNLENLFRELTSE